MSPSTQQAAQTLIYNKTTALQDNSNGGLAILLFAGFMAEAS